MRLLRPFLFYERCYGAVAAAMMREGHGMDQTRDCGLKAQKLQPARLLGEVPADQPALAEALAISQRAVSVGFEWDALGDVFDKVDEELAELREAYAQAPKDARGHVPNGPAAHEVALELGDVLFSVVNVGRKMGLSSEDSLHATCNKFRSRWECMEDLAAAAGVGVDELDTAELEKLWQEAKRRERALAAE